MKKDLQLFRIIAFLEGCTYLLFAISMPLKYLAKIPRPNFYIGMAHGILFMLYIVLLLVVGLRYRWSFKKIAVSFLVSFVPLGTFWADKNWYFKK